MITVECITHTHTHTHTHTVSHKHVMIAKFWVWRSSPCPNHISTLTKITSAGVKVAFGTENTGKMVAVIFYVVLFGCVAMHEHYVYWPIFMIFMYGEYRQHCIKVWYCCNPGFIEESFPLLMARLYLQPVRWPDSTYTVFKQLFWTAGCFGGNSLPPVLLYGH